VIFPAICGRDVEKKSLARSAQLAGIELDLRLLVDHRERLVRQPRRAQQRPALAPARPLARAQAADQRVVLKEVVDAGRAAPGALRQTARVRIARDELRRLRELTVAADMLEAEIAELVEQLAPQLLDEPASAR
jgi:hypothetical protein